MARIADDVSVRADRFLDYSFEEWEAVPSYVAEFPGWDEATQLSFVHEWAIRESHLEILADYARRDLLAAEQRARHDELLALVARHRPAIHQLLAE
jgi:hypothetical protein